MKEKGITLIALVVTIIILLILAGVTLSLTISENGLFSRAQNSADRYKSSEQNETSMLEALDKQIVNLASDNPIETPPVVQKGKVTAQKVYTNGKDGGNGITINVELEHELDEENIKEYIYYLDDEVKSQGNKEKTLEITDVERWKKYKVKVEIVMNDGTKENIGPVTIDTYDDVEGFEDLKPLVKPMTSDNSEQGSIFFSSEENQRYGYLAFDSGFHTGGYAWNGGTFTGGENNHSGTNWLGFQFNESQVVKGMNMYIFTNSWKQMVVKAKLQASNDGSSWTDLSEEQTINLIRDNPETSIYILATKNIGSYTHYRIYFTAYIEEFYGRWESGIAVLQFFG